VSATSELGNTTIVAAQAPASEANVATSLEHVEVDGADPLLSVVSTTRLPATCTQAPVGSLRAAIPSSGRGGAPMYLSALYPLSGGETSRIPTLKYLTTDVFLQIIYKLQKIRLPRPSYHLQDLH